MLIYFEFDFVEFFPVFLGLRVNSTVSLQSIKLWIEPFDNTTDRFTMRHSDTVRGITGATDEVNGAIEITQTGGPPLTREDWDVAINLPAYKLDIPVSFAIV